MSQDELGLKNAIARIKSICNASDGRSQFFPFGGSGYKASVTHYFDSSTELSRCAVQPGSVKDLQSIVKVIAEIRVPFAVKCGGHSSNPGFSSTKGIQIDLVRFNKITVHEEEKLVDVGAGCLFGELYRELAPCKLNIVGGAGIGGIGVSGWLLGGGYSAKTSRFGLGIDNIESAKVVLPDGSFREVSAKQNQDLFFAIKGGGNNFGIVTEFTLKAHEQGIYYAFRLTFKNKEDFDAVKRAIANFAEVTDNVTDQDTAKGAHLKPVFMSRNTPEGIQESITVDCVYDGSYPDDDPFKELRAIEHTIDNYGDLLPSPRTSSDQADESTTPVETRRFHVADTLHSLANGAYDLSELPEDWPEDAEIQFNIMMSGQILPITEFMGNGRLAPSSQKSKARSQQTELPAQPVGGISQFPRGRWGDVMVDKPTLEIIDEVEKQYEQVAKLVNTHGGRHVAIGIKMYTKAMFDHATESAWPHKKGQPNCPIIVCFHWEGKENDAFWIDTMKSTLKNLREKVHDLRPASKELPYFVSAALAEGTTVEDIYRENLLPLGLLKGKYDPTRVMDLAGGFKILPVYPPGQ